MKKEIYSHKNMGRFNQFLPFLSANIPLNLTLPLTPYDCTPPQKTYPLFPVYDCGLD
jgi:hypothetical protein